MATASLISQTRSLVITRINVVDVTDGRILPDSTVTISGGTIRSISRNGAPSPGAQVVDGQGRFLIPGLWDMHAHMEMAGEPWLQLYVANGVTGIRDMGSTLDVILNLREATSSGRVLGPRIFAAGPILDDAPGEWPFRMRVKTDDDGRTAVQLLKRRGADLIKVHDHTPRDAFFAIAEEARRQNLRLAGHIPIGLTAEQVIDAGQRDIEHLSNLSLWRPCSGGQKYSPDPCRPFFQLLASRGVWSTPTLGAMSEIMTIGTPASALNADQMVYASKSLRAMWAGNQSISTPNAAQFLKANADVAAVVTKDMANAGVGILAGCDSMIAGFCVHEELAAMVRGGMTPLAALQTATVNPARYFGLAGSVGTVASGRRADLVLLDANPLVDIANVGRIRAVIAAGRFLDRSELDTLLARVRAATSQQ
jgi:imidazolonepropionase-like amidohydrolase